MKTCNTCNQSQTNYKNNICPSCDQQPTISNNIDNNLEKLEIQYDILIMLLQDDSQSYRQEELSTELNSIALAIKELQE